MLFWTGVGEVTNTYVTSTYVTNTDFQSALANTNAYIATKTDDSTVLATNTSLRTLIDDRMQVANVEAYLANTNSRLNVLEAVDNDQFASNANLQITNDNVSDRMQVANTIALYNTLVSNTLSTANATATFATKMDVANTRTLVNSRLGATASVTLTGDATGSASFSSNAVSISTSLANNITIGNDLTVSHDLFVSGNLQVSGTTTTISANNLTVQDNFIYLNDGGGNTNIDMGWAGGYNAGSYAHAGVFRDATDGRFKFFDQYIPEIDAAVDIDTSHASFTLSQVQANTFIGDLQGNAPQYLEVANVSGYFTTYWPSANVITYTNKYLEVANVVSTDLTSYWPSANIITYTAKYLEVANNTGGASVTVQNTAPTITSNGDLWWDNSDGELYVAYANNWVEAVAQDVTPYTNNASYTTGNTTFTFVRTDGSQYEVTIDLSGVGEVSNSYLTSTYVTNTVFQSALANTNSYIATKTDDSTVLATNTALRTLISDRIQVANADSKYATWSSLISTNTAIRSYVDTEVAALVNSAPTTLNTLEELATALGDDANFSTTVLTLIGTKASNATLTSTYVTNTVFQSSIDDRLQVANAAYVTANTISIKNPANYHEYAVTVDTKTSAHPYSGGSSSAYFLDGVESPSIVLAPNQTYRFDQSDSTNSSHPLDFYVDADKNTAYTTGVTVSGTAGSAGAYTEIVVDEDTPQVLYYQCQNHSYMGSVASILSDTSPQYLQVANSTSFITSSALTPYLQVANVATELADYWPSANIIAYTAKYLEVANNIGSSAANTSTTSASLSGNTATFTRADSSTFTLDLSGIASAGGGGGGASVTVANTAPVSPTEGDLYFDNELATMFIYYDSSWVEVQPSIDPINPLTYGIDTFTANGTATDFTHTSETVSADAMLVTVDGIIQRPTTDYTVSSKTVTFGTAPSNTSIVAVRVTTGAFTGVSNATFQSALANTNSYIASLGTGDVSNSYLTSTFTTNAVFQSALANTNAYIATKSRFVVFDTISTSYKRIKCFGNHRFK
jgi:hypothetical protein